jgi:hypothetical protein
MAAMDISTAEDVTMASVGQSRLVGTLDAAKVSYYHRQEKLKIRFAGHVLDSSRIDLALPLLERNAIHVKSR